MNMINTTIPVDAEVARELVAHLRNRTTDQAESQLRVPIAHFTNPDHLAAEIALMRRLPLVVGHVSEIATPGDFITRTVLDAPVIVTRQQDGSVAAFRNMCRHRGGVVEQEASGKKRAFTCQYHGWSYDAENGALKPVFYEDSFGSIDYACRGLHRLKAEVRHGLIFVTLRPDRDAPSIGDYIGPEVDAQIEPWDLAGARIFLDHTFHRPMNWKLVMDGAIDPLHPLFLHNKPGGVGSRTINNTAIFREWGRHGKMFAARDKLKALVDSEDEGGVSSKHVGAVMVLYPNALYVDAPDHVEFWNVWPSLTDPGQCSVNIRVLVRPDILTPAMEARIRKSWAILEQAALEEDFPMEAAIQRNAQAFGEDAFIYGRNEKPPQHLHRQLARDLARDLAEDVG